MSDRPRLLDLFCGAGGAAMGYHRAGFDVVGVDLRPQPNYPFTFMQADALEILRGEMRYVLADDGWRLVSTFDAIHASPPCQRYSQTQKLKGREHPDLVAPTRTGLRSIGLPWVMENVAGAPFADHHVVLCGTSFGLGLAGFELRRHRLFEASFPILVPKCEHRLPAFPVFGHSVNTWFRQKYGRTFGNDDRRKVMGVPWMAWDEIGEAIPPAFTEYVGQFLLDHLEAVAA